MFAWQARCYCQPTPAGPKQDLLVIFVVQFEPLKGLAVFSGKAVGVCTPLNSLWLCAPIASLGALITTKEQGEG